MEEEKSNDFEMNLPIKRSIEDDMSDESSPTKIPRTGPGKYNNLTREELVRKLEHFEQRLGAVLHRKSCLESDISEKNAKLAAIIAATNFSEEKINQIYSQAGIEKKKNQVCRDNGQKKSFKPIEPWILELEVETLVTGEKFKIFEKVTEVEKLNTFNKVPESHMIECMVCKPLKKVIMMDNQLSRHFNGKVHIRQMKNFKYIPSEDPNATKFMSEVFTPSATNSSQDGPALSEILLQEVENLETSERIKAFIQPNPPSTVLQCMICKKPGRNIEIRSNQFTRHTNGKYHMEQMKKFSILQTT